MRVRVLVRVHKASGIAPEEFTGDVKKPPRFRHFCETPGALALLTRQLLYQLSNVSSAHVSSTSYGPPAAGSPDPKITPSSVLIPGLHP